MDCSPIESLAMHDSFRFLLRDATQRVRYCYSKSSVRPSMTLRYRDHIGWNFSTIISRLVSLGSLLSADLNIMDLCQREHPEILTGTRVGYAERWLSAYKSSTISEMQQDITMITIAKINDLG